MGGYEEINPASIAACLSLPEFELIGLHALDQERAGVFNPTKTYAVFMPPTQVSALPLPSETPVPGGALVPVGTGVSISTPEPSATLLPSATLIPADTAIPPPPTAIVTWVWHDAGQATLPILLYHHIASDGGENRYYVNPENFRQQMHALRDWGYTSITPSYLAQVLIHGGELPERPVIITFDDGNEDVYINAFPILQEFGFVGTFYIVADKIGSYNLVDAEQLRELVSAGWEIGSHSSTHLDLTSDYSQMEYEGPGVSPDAGRGHWHACAVFCLSLWRGR